MSDATAARKPESKAGWRRRNDAGPHTATFPSGAVLKFTIPDSGSLLVAGRLPDRLRETALLCAGHPEGAEGFMLELVTTAIVQAERSELVTQAIEDGIALGHHLVAAMLVEPKVTAEEVAAGEFPELDVKMLLEFAERRRNLDAVGQEVPVAVVTDYARFRAEPPSENGARDGRESGRDARGDGADADDDEVRVLQ